MMDFVALSIDIRGQALKVLADQRMANMEIEFERREDEFRQGFFEILRAPSQGKGTDR